MKFRKIVDMFKSGNVCVTGLRGSGKDVLTGNVIARRKRPYVSNLDYSEGKHYQELDFEKLDMGKNTYLDLLAGKVKYYKWPYEPESDVYISDAGVYLPAQFCNELNKKFPYLPMYFALSRQVSHNNFHVNVQHLGRVWDKIREQSDIYIRCRRCKFLFGKIVFQQITLYDKYQSALDRVQPCRISVPIFAKREVKQQAELHRDKFFNTYGSVKNRILIYWNKSSHDTYYFEKLFLGGEQNEKQS